MNQIQDDEIDLFELFQMLWDGKGLISVFIVLTTLMGFGYSQVAQPKYDVSVPYTFNIYSMSAKQICGSHIDCLEKETMKHLSPSLEGGWSLNFSLSTPRPLDLSEYQSQLDGANVALTNAVYREAIIERNLIQTELTNALLSTETVAKNMLDAKRTIQVIENGKNVITFGSVSVVQSAPKATLIIILSVLLGGLLGVSFVLLRSAVRRRKEALA